MATQNPEPARKRVLLVSAGIPQPKPTVHHFVETKPTVIKGVPYFEFIFQCFETGARRRYGLADRLVLGETELADDIEREGN